MHNIKFIRENPAAFDAGMMARGLELRAPTLLELDEQRRQLQTQQQTLLADRKRISKDIGDAKRNKDEETASRLSTEVAAIKEQLVGIEAKELGIATELQTYLDSTPNIPGSATPIGKDESENVVISTHGKVREYSFTPKPHEVIGQELGQLSSEDAVKMSGSRFVLLRGKLAKLERVLGQFMIDTQTQQFGYEEVSPPYLVKDKALFGTGQLPKFEEDQFKTTTGHYLIPTAEVSITNIIADSIVSEQSLPMRMVALTPSFRSEAGSAGRDTAGLIRLHQFFKTELVHICTPEQDAAEFEHLQKAACNILEALELPYRKVRLCSGDIGFAHEETIDLEVWMPAQNTYREISSCSRFGAFQACRMNARSRKDTDKPRFVHTLNGSGLAVGRTLAAVIENYQNEDGSITIPTVLREAMGCDTIQ